MKVTNIMIIEFLEAFSVEVYEMPFHALELLMDDHKCIKWGGVEYFVPENCTFYNKIDDIIYEHLIRKFSL